MALARLLSPRLLLFITLLFLTVSASIQLSTISPRSSWNDEHHQATGVATRQAGAAMRILCLGASITFGVGSTDGNGYREKLRNLLVSAGNTVHFVGTQTGGNMVNDINEGYPGLRIDQVTGYAWNSYGYYPNVVLIHLGTNDMAQGYAPNVSANNMGILIDQIYSVLPSDALVVVSKLLPNKKASTESGIDQLNYLLDDVVSQRSDQGLNCVLADMHSNEFSISDLGPDGTHPLDEGYQKMAGVWNDAISNAVSTNRIGPLKTTTASDNDNTNNVHCDFTSDSIGKPATVEFGFGNKTSTYKSVFVDKGVIVNDTAATAPYASIFFARVDDSHTGDSYIHVAYDGTLSAAYNNGDDTFGPIQKGIGHLPTSCGYTSIRWGDINGDGIDDFICINGGNAQVYLTAKGSAFSWSQLDMTIPVSGNVYIGDIDGDGFADVITVTDGGDVSVIYPIYSNNAYSTSWTIPNFDASSTHFFDVNGDGRADYISVAEDTTVSAVLNYRGSSPVAPYWQDNGIIRHAVAEANLTSINMKFGKIRGTPYPAKVDIATVHKDGSVKSFENHGYSGFAWLPYIRHCDMTGSGSESFMTMGKSGSLKLFQNIHNGGIHVKYGEILGDQGLNRNDVHLADLDGDGKCDYIALNNQTGEVSVRFNEGVTYDGNTSSSISLSGSSSWSVTNLNEACISNGVWFADLDGDGKSDYICVDRSGNVFTGLNTGGGFDLSTSSVFSASGDMTSELDRALISFADINGDGYADYLFFNPGDGSVTARLNTGKGQAFGSANKIYSDSTFVGGFLVFANINGLGRADMVNFNQLSSKGKMSANRCPNPVPPTGIGPNPNPPGGSAPIHNHNPTPTSPTGPSDTGACASTNSPAPVEGDWQQKTCSGPEIATWLDGGSSSDLWDALDADDAWSSAVSAWESRQPACTLTFPEVIARTWARSTNPEFRCQTLTISGQCSATLSCGEVNYPAAWMIVNSFVGMHTTFANFYEAITDAQSNVTNLVGNITATFGNVPQANSDALSALLNILSVGLAAVSTPLFSSAISTIGEHAADISNTVAGLANAVVGQASQDKTTSKQLSDQNELSTQVSIIATAWLTAVNTTYSSLFNGSANQTTTLFQDIYGGPMFADYGNDPSLSLEIYMTRALNSFLINYAWQLGKESVIVIEANYTCTSDTDYPKGSGAQDISVLHPTYYCVQSRGYYLSQTPKTVCSSKRGTAPPPCQYYVGPPTGYESLPTFGLSARDIVVGSVSTWQASGQKNVQQDMTSPAFIGGFIDSISGYDNPFDLSKVATAYIYTMPVLPYAAT